MIGLLIKDFYVLGRTAKIYLAMIAFYLVLAVTGAFTFTMVGGFLVMFIMMLPISSFGYDEVARWDSFVAALPVGRRGIVGEKYLLVLCLSAAAGVLLIAFSIVLWLAKGGSLSDMIDTGLACLAVGLFINGLLLPFLFQYGAEKGRIIMMIIFAVTFLIGFGAAKLIDLPGGAAAPPWLDAAILPALLAVVAAVLYLSYRISLGIYKRKEL